MPPEATTNCQWTICRHGGRHEFLVGQAAGACFDQRLIPSRDHELVPDLLGEVLQPEKRDEERKQRNAPGNDELALPVGRAEVVDRVHRHQRGNEASRHRADGPKAHGRGATQLGAVVAHQCRGGHEDGPLDDPDQAVEHEEGPLAVGQGDAHGGEQSDDQQSVDDDVRPANTIRPAGRQRGERSEEIGRHDDVDEEGKAHVVAGQDVRRHTELREVRVVEDDGVEDGQAQIGGATPTLGVDVDGVRKEEAAHWTPYRVVDRAVVRWSVRWLRR
jgi:hypothetical protein